MTEQQQASTALEDAEETGLFDILQVIVENLRLLVIGPVVAGLIALCITFVIRPTFTATTTFLPPQQQQSTAAAMLQTLGALGGAPGGAGLKNPADQYIALANSRSVRDALIERFNLLQHYEGKIKDDVRKELKEATRIAAGRDGLIRLEVDDHDRKLAADLANAYVEELSKLIGRLALTESQQRRALFEMQLAKAKEGLTKAESALRATGINESALKASPVTAVASVAALMAQISAKEVQLGAMRNALTDTAPEFVRAQSELSALRAQLAKAEKDSNGANSSGDYVAKYREYKYYEVLFELMAKQYEIARVDESREGAAIQVVDVALVPERKSKPRRFLAGAITALVAEILLMFFVFARQSFRNARKNAVVVSRLESLRAALSQSMGKRKSA
jgi:tyrosine-protein kinase Etk/Wzc